MKFIEYNEKLLALTDMAEHKRAGTPGQLAKKFGVSERTIQRMVETLRDHGHPVVFDRGRNSYILQEEKK